MTMTYKNRKWTSRGFGVVLSALTLTAACGGGDGMTGDLELPSDDATGEPFQVDSETSRDDGSTTVQTDRVTHTQEEIEAYRALLAENGGPVLVEKIGGSCGNRSGFVAQVTTTFVPPDHFPPDSLIGLPIGVVTAGCLLAGVAEFHEVGCDVHDVCYATQGRSKESCDSEFRTNLRAECGRTYDTILSRACRTSCRAVAELMYEAVSNFGGDAYEAAQRHPIGSTATPHPPDPACLALCEQNCLSLSAEQIGECQFGCADTCRG